MIGEIFVKKLYVGLGGIGCRTLRVFEKETKKSDSVRFLYLDNDVYTENDLPEESFFCFDVNKLIKATPFEYQGIDMDSYFANEFFDADKIELIFVTSSFGDFGSKNLFEIANFISSTILTSNLCRQFSVSIKALVFSHENFCSCFSETENKINELHTVQFLTDCSKRVVKNPNDTSTIDSFTYNYVDIFLITDPEADEEKLFKLFYLNNEELRKLDCSEKFYNSAVSYNEKTTVDEENSSDSVKANDANSATDGYAFISYSSKNQSSADAMRKLFNKNGIDTWMAPYDIPAGSEYAEVLYDALENCSCLVLMLTNNSQNSKWVRSEVDIAVSNGKAVIPVKLEDIELNSSMKTYLAGRQIVPVHVIDEGSYEIQSLLDGVRNFVNTADNNINISTEKESESNLPIFTPVHENFAVKKETSAYKTAEEMQAEFAKANVGDTITFGSYEQDSEKWEHKEPIEWLVLARKKDRMLIITKYCIEGSDVFCDYANERYTALNWLNNTFVNYAFNYEEKKIMKNRLFRHNKLFFLKSYEVEKHFISSEARVTKATVYAVAHESGSYTDKFCEWFIASRTSFGRLDEVVDRFGEISSPSVKSYRGYYCAGIRPAMWIDLKSKK